MIGTDVSTAFEAGSGLATADVRLVIATLAVVSILLFSSWYLIRIFTRGFKQADFPHAMTGTVLIMVLVFFVLWLTAQDWSIT